MALNHKWDKNDNCIKCGIYREMQTEGTRILENGVYKHVGKTQYTYFIDDNGKTTRERPLCYRTTYDD